MGASNFFHISKRTIIAIGFMLSMSMLGLEFPLSYVLLFGILVFSFTRNRYDFLIQLLLLSSGFGFYDPNLAFPIKVQDVLIVSSLFCVPLLLKDKLQRKLIVAILLYIVVLALFAMMSDESFVVQLRRLREYSSIIFFTIPLMIFKNRRFSLKVFSNRIIEYSVIILSFYAIDSLLLGSHLLVPRTFGGDLVWTSIQIDPFSNFVRKYPSGAIFALLLIYPLTMKIVRVNFMRIVLIVSGILVTKTISFISAFLFIILLFQRNLNRMLFMFSLLFCATTLLYYIDLEIGGEFRIVQFVDQLSELSNAKTDTDLASFGTGRGAQVIPKFENLINRGHLMTGFGFIHPELSKSKDYEVLNTYSIKGNVIEQSGMVEVTQLQTVLDIGIIGLIIQHLFYLSLFFVIRNCRYKKYYLSILIGLTLLGIGGFYGLNAFQSLSMLGLVLACVVLENNSKRKFIDFYNIVREKSDSLIK